MSDISGFLNIDKPLGITSHDVVAQVRRGLNIKRVGHAGTLDPLATGVLIICVGSATRLSEYAMASTKRYRARVQFGVVTTTYDSEGEVVHRADVTHLSRDDVLAALPQFTGEIAQLPPMYSAVKQGGRKLYELARAGEEVERQPRTVRIDALTITDWQPPEITLEVVCGAGTYIRSLAFDLGETLGVGAHLSGLVRTASGHFSLTDAVTLDGLFDGERWRTALLPPDTPLLEWMAIHLDADTAAHVLQGRYLEGAQVTDGTLARGYDPQGRLLAVLLAEGGKWRPYKVFS